MITLKVDGCTVPYYYIYYGSAAFQGGLLKNHCKTQSRPNEFRENRIVQATLCYLSTVKKNPWQLLRESQHLSQLPVYFQLDCVVLLLSH